MALTKDGVLSSCLIPTNCVLIEWKFDNVMKSYDKLIRIAESLPRVRVVERTENYWHGIVRSLIFRFPDDLEILKIPNKGIIQVRSASRLGLGDLGVNRNRIENLYSQL
ncbi:conserved hypothetical protein [Prochlorococcus marinus str. MIT 9313]|uniref:DUF1499 domain-containing protein n=1 Tax=Prochlorococcus marinus (strain MIT 9313) TaxID=74547 RepID=Q7V905_PROMM|nr:DUF1499 domain-containing protein [Prochlorococcus marinus]CAE20336.1 conserved hypothetical protein [Prochlorococcus marinus str. MIT 9313]